MKTLVLMALLATQSAYAGSNDFSDSDGGKKPIAVEKMRYQLEIKGEILVLDKTGRRILYKGDEGRSWKFGDDKPLVSNWSYKQKGFAPVALRHEWDLGADGVMTVKIKQYESMERGQGEEPTFGKLLKEKEFKLENFESIRWVLSQDDSKRVVAKLEPILWTSPEPSEVGRLPLNSGRMTIYDSKGNLWASRLDNSDGRNVYFGVTTSQGSVFLSYLPFKGAKEIGLAEKSRIKVEDNGIKLVIESVEPFLPKGISAKVYGMFDLNKRTDRVNSVRSFGSDTEDGFLKHIQR